MLKIAQPLSLDDLAVRLNQGLAGQLQAAGLPPDLTAAAEVRGDGGALIDNLAAVDEAGPGSLTFAVTEAFLEKAQAAGAAALIVPPHLAETSLSRPALVCPEPRLAFTVILGLLAPEPRPRAGQAFFADRASLKLGRDVIIGDGAYIGAGASIGDGTVIHPLAYVDDGVVIGRDCRIHPRAVLRAGTRVGDRCQIHSGAVIGGDGFGYAQLPWPAGGRLVHFKNEHRGGVLIEDDVEIGSNTTIDKGLVADTVIGRGSRIDNLVQVGHNVRLGRDCVVVSQSGIGGHTVVGDRVFLLGQAGLGPGVTLGDDLILTAQSGLGSGSLPPGRQVWMGTPPRPMDEFQRTQALTYSQLPRLRKFFQILKKCASFDDLKTAFFEAEGKENK